MAQKTFTACDGTMMLTLEPQEGGGYQVSSPLDPEIRVTAMTLEEAFDKAYTSAHQLALARAREASRTRPTDAPSPLKTEPQDTAGSQADS